MTSTAESTTTAPSKHRERLWACHENHEQTYRQDPNKSMCVLPWQDGELNGWNGAATVQDNELALQFDARLDVSRDDGPLQLQDAATILRDMMILAIKVQKQLPNDRYEYTEGAVLALQNAIELFVQATLDPNNKCSQASLNYVPDHRKNDTIEDVEHISWRELRCSQNVSHIYPWDDAKQGRLVQFKDGTLKFWDDYVAVQGDKVSIRFSGKFVDTSVPVEEGKPPAIKSVGGMYTDDALALLREMAQRLLTQNYSFYLMCAIKNVQTAINLADMKAWKKHQFSWSKRENAYKPPYMSIFNDE